MTVWIIKAWKEQDKNPGDCNTNSLVTAVSNVNLGLQNEQSEQVVNLS